MHAQISVSMSVFVSVSKSCFSMSPALTDNVFVSSQLRLKLGSIVQSQIVHSTESSLAEIGKDIRKLL